MKKILFYFILGATISVNAGTIDQKLDHFTSVTATGNFKVTLKPGEEEKVTIINTDEKIVDEKILAEVEGSELVIKIKGDTYKERQIEIIVYYKKIIEVTSRRGCWLIIKDTLKGDRIMLTSISGGKIKANVDCENVQLKISKGGSIKVTGKALIAEYLVVSGGTIGAVNLNAETVTATVKVAGEIICSVEKKFTVSVGGGSVSYRGNPEEITESTSLGGEITKMKN